MPAAGRPGATYARAATPGTYRDASSATAHDRNGHTRGREPEEPGQRLGGPSCVAGRIDPDERDETPRGGREDGFQRRRVQRRRDDDELSRTPRRGLLARERPRQAVRRVGLDGREGVQSRPEVPTEGADGVWRRAGARGEERRSATSS